MNVHLIDGTYELFRHFYALPSAKDADGHEIAAVRGVVNSVLGMIQRGTTHVGVATDHVIESFRNRLWRGYKTGAGVDPNLLAQFEPLEVALYAAGIVVWPMVEYEADDALASAAEKASADKRVQRVIICTPDKDLSQSVRGDRVVQLNRRTGDVRTEPDVVKKFGVGPGWNPRLARARRRFVRRLPRAPRMGAEVGVGGSGALQAARGYPARLSRVARERPERRRAGPGARGAEGFGLSLSGSRDAQDGRACLRVGGRAAVDRRPAGVRGDRGEDGECNMSHGFRGSRRTTDSTDYTDGFVCSSASLWSAASCGTTLQRRPPGRPSTSPVEKWST